MEAAEALREFYPPEEYLVAETSDRDWIEDLLASRSASTLGGGPVQGTDYYVLASPSPLTSASKRLIIVCRTAYIADSPPSQHSD